ncbi:MAG: exonuclease SbcCD subunit D [bacterium]|nr:exonuclease SbcCD subunit D [bacterium]
MKFIHCADIHLGKTYYNNETRYNDFFDAFSHVVEKAVAEKVDALFIAGDLFHNADIKPLTLSKTIDIMEPLKRAGIEVVAISGNHDRIHKQGELSWLQFLSLRGYVRFLQPSIDTSTGEINFPEWDDTKKTGGKINIKGVNIYGLGYFGATGGLMAKKSLVGIDPKQNNILLFHTGVWEYAFIDIGNISKDELMPLKDSFDYVALGHGHNRYEIDNFAYNPGSLENVNLGEEKQEKGFYIVEFEDSGPKPEYITLKTRPLLRFEIDVSESHSSEDIYKKITEYCLSKEGTVPPGSIIFIRIAGKIHFHSYEIESDIIRRIISEKFSPLYIDVENNTSLTSKRIKREDNLTLEEQVKKTIQEMIEESEEHRVYSKELSDLVFKFKDFSLSSSCNEQEIIDYIQKERKRIYED